MASSPDPAALQRFRTSLSAALAATDRSAFDAACRALALSTRRPLPDLLASPQIASDPDLTALVALAADMHWLQSPLLMTRPPPAPHAKPTTWAGVLKRAVANAPHNDDAASLSSPLSPSLPAAAPPPPDAMPPLTAPVQRQPHAFVPALPPHPLTLPTAILHAHNGLVKTSFRRWKWESSSLPPSAQIPPPPADLPPNTPLTALLRKDAPSDSSSVASTSSQHSQPAQLIQRQSHYVLDSPSLLPKSHTMPPTASNDFEAILLANMPNLSEARPAGVAAAAAFRALAPFLAADDQLALQRAFSTASPLDCLAMVLRVAEHASAKMISNCSATANRRVTLSSAVTGGGDFTSSAEQVLADVNSKSSVWGTSFGATTWESPKATTGAPVAKVDIGLDVGPAVLRDADIGSKGSFVGLASSAVVGSSTVWGTDNGKSNGLVSRPVDTHYWGTAVYSESRQKRANSFSGTTGSGLDVNATPFMMERLQTPHESGL